MVGLFFCKIVIELIQAGRFQIGIDEAVQITVHDRIDITGFKAGTVILHHRVRHEHIGTNLCAPCNFLLYAFDILNLFEMFPFLDFQQLGFQHRHGNIPVLVLAALYL